MDDSYQGDAATEPLALLGVSGVWTARSAPVHCRGRYGRNESRPPHCQYRSWGAALSIHTTAARM